MSGQSAGRVILRLSFLLDLRVDQRRDICYKLAYQAIID
jgi:hypothetical protein